MEINEDECESGKSHFSFPINSTQFKDDIPLSILPFRLEPLLIEDVRVSE